MNSSWLFVSPKFTRAPETGGETGLVGGKRVAKDSPRVEAYGTVDELNSIVGLARVFNEEDRESGEGHRFLDEVLCQIQDELFDLGSELATPPEFFQAGMYRVGADEIKRLEKWIDQCQKDLEPLQSFILPGGGTHRRLPAPVPHGVPARRTGCPALVARRR